MTGLADLVGYQLHLVDLFALREAREALAGVDLTPANVTALVFVRDNAGCDQIALGRMLAVNRSSAMKMVDKLAARSLVERRPGRDLRCNALHLTRRGNRVLQTVLDLLRDADESLCAGLDRAERALLLDLLVRLNARAAGLSHSGLPSLLPASGPTNNEERAK
jgi:DNA-binding MarR family transcriptional regulator